MNETPSTIQTCTEYARVRTILDERQSPPAAARAALDDALNRIETMHQADDSMTLALIRTAERILAERRHGRRQTPPAGQASTRRRRCPR